LVKITLTTFGKSTGLVLPEEALSRLKVQAGDEIFLSETTDGYLLSSQYPEQSLRQIADRVMTRYSETLKKLAE